MNESTFEARLDAAIRRVFPTFFGQITHQDNFRVRLGHHELKLGGHDSKGGRSDILLSFEGKPLAVLELKAPDIPINAVEDVHQAVSYSRLLVPNMAPLSVVTNGAQTIIVRTHDCSPLEGGTLSESALQTLISQASRVAASEEAGAIRCILDGVPDAWRLAFRQSIETFVKDETGDISDFERVLVDGFLIPRDATRELCCHVKNQCPVVLIEGAPLTGKTNVLHQAILQLENAPVFFLAFADTRHGILLQMARAIRRATGLHMTDSEVEHWLETRNMTEGSVRPILVIDSVEGDISGEAFEELQNLAKMASHGMITLILAVNEYSSMQIRKRYNSATDTPIGRNSKIVKLGHLTRSELSAANNDLAIRWRCVVPECSFLNPLVYRPYWLRFFLARLCQHESIPKLEPDAALGIPSILQIEELIHYQRWVNQDAVVSELSGKYAKALLAYLSAERVTTLMQMRFWQSCALPSEALHGLLDSTEIASMEKRGILVRQPVDDCSYLMIRNPESIISFLPKLIARQAISLFAKDVHISGENAGKWFLRICEAIPLGDVVGQLALMDINEGAPLAFHAIMDFLMKQEFSDSKPIKKGAKIAVFLGEDRGFQQVDSKILDAISEKEIGVTQEPMAWAVILSRLAAETFGGDLHYQIIEKIGVLPGPLVFFDCRIQISDTKVVLCGVEEIEVPEIKWGYIEPLVISISQHLLKNETKALDWIESSVTRGLHLNLLYRQLAAIKLLEITRGLSVEMDRVGRTLSDTIRRFVEEKSNP